MKENTEISARIIQILDYLSVSKNIFAKSLGYSRSQSIYDIINGKSKPSFDFFNKLYSSEYSELINPIWLLTGKGEMLLTEDKEVAGVKLNGNNAVVIPLYNAEASAGVGALQLDSEYVIDKLQVPFARNEDIALTIVGDSMTPAMQSGDIAVVRNMPNWREYLDFGNIFIVVTENEVYCKVIAKHISKDIFALKSYNTDYGEFEIPKKYIREVYKVVGIISQRSY